MLQWRNWHTRQIQTLFSPGSTPGWSTIFEINSGGDFVNNISAVAIGMLIAAHREGDEEKFRAYVELIAETYEQQGNDHAANIIRSYYTGDYGEQGKVILDEATEQISRNCLEKNLLSIKYSGAMTAFRCSAYARTRTKNCISATAQKCEAKNAGSCIRRRSSKSNKSSAKARPRPKYSGIAV